MEMQEAYKAIADPTRRRILKCLREGAHTVGDLAEQAGVTRSLLSHHLTILKLANLVRVERRGQFQVYSLNTTVFQDLMMEVLGWFGNMHVPADLQDETLFTTEEEPCSDQPLEKTHE
ncbi:hypothetical protein KSD_87000 [Ktedonobacter sp. SOSP1-85]|nr:metalloregulator ArsR/SmtB family transcription factor [Ktedonobacter sp. SOSP1-85]GHO80929.1 hypothetical protein KSD_87000 [Ktedonobacter sp. SOSP1-85]